jgi:hypothetical protein
MERRGWARIRQALESAEDNSLCWFGLGPAQNLLHILVTSSEGTSTVPTGKVILAQPLR